MRAVVCALAVAARAFAPAGRSFHVNARRTIPAAAAAEDCGCGVAFRGDVPAAARALDARAVLASTPILDVDENSALVLPADANGVTVVAFLRSFGWPFCQELLVQLEARRAELGAGGVSLLAVGIGTSQVAREIAAHVGYAETQLFADPTNTLYDELLLNKGLARTFFNAATPLAIKDRLASGNFDELGAVLSKWLPAPGRAGAVVIPPTRDQAFNQGGMFVFDGPTTLLAHYDVSTGAHADLEETVQIALAAAAARQ